MAFPNPGMRAAQNLRNASAGAYLASRRSRGGGGPGPRGCGGCIGQVLALLIFALVVLWLLRPALLLSVFHLFIH